MTASAPSWLRRLPQVRSRAWRHGWTTGAGPDYASVPDGSDHAAAVARLVAAVGLREGAWVDQVHGGRALRAEDGGFLGEADALWTTAPGLGVVGRSADCPLILVAGRDAAGRGLWGFAHASWRSTLAGIATRLLQDMVAGGLRPDRTRAVICPSAGPCCYEVGTEVRTAARNKLGTDADAFFPRLGARVALDLWRANGAALAAAGLANERIFVAGICTICGGTDYPSHRREHGHAGRFAAISGGDH